MAIPWRVAYCMITVPLIAAQRKTNRAANCAHRVFVGGEGGSGVEDGFEGVVRLSFGLADDGARDFSLRRAALGRDVLGLKPVPRCDKQDF